MAKTVFDLKNSKKIVFSISSVFAFKQGKPYVVSGETFKKNYKFFLCAYFRVIAQIFWGLATKERGNLKTRHFGIGVLQ